MVAGKQLTDIEMQQAAALMTGIWSALTGEQGPSATVESAIAAMGTGFAFGDGKQVSLDTPEVRVALAGFLKMLSESDLKIAEYMVEHPGAHSISELRKVLGTTVICAEISLYGLMKHGLVDKLPVKLELTLDADGNETSRHVIVRFQIKLVEWLRHVRGTLEARDRVNSGAADQ